MGQLLVSEAEDNVFGDFKAFLRQLGCNVEKGLCRAGSRCVNDSRQLCRVNFNGILAVDQGDRAGHDMQEVAAMLDKRRDVKGPRLVYDKA